MVKVNQKQLKQNCHNLKIAIKQKEKKLINIAIKETGVPIRYHREDLKYVCDLLDNLPSLLINYLEQYKKEKIEITPKGNSLIVLSANEPFIMTFVPLLHALSLNNNILIKPSPFNKNFASHAIKIISSTTSWNKRVKQVMFDNKTIQRFVNKTDLDSVCWFGSSKTIKKVGKFFSDKMIEFIPECEGNDLLYLGKTGNINSCTKAVIESLCKHNGQCCNAAKGIFVAKDIKDDFLQEIKKEFKKMKIGLPTEENTDVVIQDRFKIDEYIKKRRLNNKLLSIISYNEKKKPPLIILTPELSENLFEKAEFSSIQWMTFVEDINQALKLINKNKFGLAFTIYSQNKKEINLVKETVKCARINVNKNPISVSYSEPWGGIKLSGHGGVSSWFEKFSNRQLINE